MALIDLDTAGNLAAGVGGFYKGYTEGQDRDLKRKQQEQDALYKQRLLEIDQLHKGIIKSPDGGLMFTPEEEQKKLNENRLLQAQANWYSNRLKSDPTIVDGLSYEEARKAAESDLQYDPQSKQFKPTTWGEREREARLKKMESPTVSQEALAQLYNQKRLGLIQDQNTPETPDPVRAALAKKYETEAKTEEMRQKGLLNDPVKSAQSDLIRAKIDQLKKPTINNGVSPYDQARIDYLKAKTKSVGQKPGGGSIPVSKENQQSLNKLATTNAHLAAISSQLAEAYKQMSDPSLPDDQRLAAGRESLKIMNSPMGADAVGAEESRRFGAFLNFKPDLDAHKYKIGADLDGATSHLGNMISRFNNAIQNNEKVMSAVKQGQPMSAGLLQQGEALKKGPQKSVELAKKVLSSPKATPDQKRNAQKFLDEQGVK